MSRLIFHRILKCPACKDRTLGIACDSHRMKYHVDRLALVKNCWSCTICLWGNHKEETCHHRNQMRCLCGINGYESNHHRSRPQKTLQKKNYTQGRVQSPSQQPQQGK